MTTLCKHIPFGPLYSAPPGCELDSVREKKVVPVIAELVPTEEGTLNMMVSQQESVVAHTEDV